MRSRITQAMPAIVVIALLSGCAALSGGDSDEKPEKRAGALETAPAADNASAQQRLTDALAAIYADRGGRSLRYYSKFADLNGDGKREAVAFVVGPGGCADGCDLYVLAPDGDRYEALSRIPTSKAPVYQLDHAHHGWHDLLVSTLGHAGGSDRQRMQYEGGGYVPVDDDSADDTARTPLIANLDGPGHSIPAGSGNSGQSD